MILNSVNNNQAASFSDWEVLKYRDNMKGIKRQRTYQSPELVKLIFSDQSQNLIAENTKPNTAY